MIARGRLMMHLRALPPEEHRSVYAPIEIKLTVRYTLPINGDDAFHEMEGPMP